jgi:hypothetical protein
VTLTPPDPAATRELATTAVTAYAAGSSEFAEVVRDGPVRALARPAEPPLDALAELVAVASGGTPLLGTGLRAGTYDALLWNAARCGGDPGVSCLLAGLVTAGSGLDEAAGEGPAFWTRLPADPAAEPLRRAVHAGLTVIRAARDLLPVSAPARPTLGVLGVATTCALLDGATPDDLAAVLDLAASLMLTTAARGAEDEDVALLRAGHACAAGYTAVVVRRAGMTRLPGAFAHTLSVVAGVGVR